MIHLSESLRMKKFHQSVRKTAITAPSSRKMTTMEIKQSLYVTCDGAPAQ